MTTKLAHRTWPQTIARALLDFRPKMQNHTPFWIELAGKLGAPILSATLVLCLLTGKLEPLHIVLIGIGLALIVLEHWYSHHRGR